MVPAPAADGVPNPAAAISFTELKAVEALPRSKTLAQLILLAALPVMLELISGGSGAGNAGGLVIAVITSLCTGAPWIAFLILGLVSL